MSRSCHNCGMCCTMLAVEEIDKPVNVRCMYLRGSRCTIYQDRPKACRVYRCAWLQGANVPKPNKAGFIVDPAKEADLTIRLGDRVSKRGNAWLNQIQGKVAVILMHKDERQIVGPTERVTEILQTLFPDKTGN